MADHHLQPQPYTVRLTDGTTERVVEVEATTAQHARRLATSPGWEPVHKGTKPLSHRDKTTAKVLANAQSLTHPAPWTLDDIVSAAPTATPPRRVGPRRRTVTTVAETMEMLQLDSVLLAGLLKTEPAKLRKWLAGDERPNPRSSTCYRTEFLTCCTWAAYRVFPNMRLFRKWLLAPQQDGQTIAQTLLDNSTNLRRDIPWVPSSLPDTEALID